MAVPLSPGSSRAMRVLRFLDVLEDDDPTKLSWTKIGVAFTTLLNILTLTTAALQQSIDNIGHTNWQLLLTAGGLHAVTKTAHEVKRRTERNQGN